MRLTFAVAAALVVVAPAIALGSRVLARRAIAPNDEQENGRGPGDQVAEGR
jgi:hypothetical protein